MTNLDLAGLDARDVVSARHPWLQLAALPPAPPRFVPPPARWNTARRLRVAAYTPSGERQPSELAGVDASARVPNAAQPEPGEFHAGHEVNSGRPAFFGPLMPPPTGVANGVGVPSGPIAATHPFGAPPTAAYRLPLAALPRVYRTQSKPKTAS